MKKIIVLGAVAVLCNMGIGHEPVAQAAELSTLNTLTLQQENYSWWPNFRDDFVDALLDRPPKPTTPPSPPGPPKPSVPGGPGAKVVPGPGPRRDVHPGPNQPGRVGRPPVGGRDRVGRPPVGGRAQVGQPPVGGGRGVPGKDDRFHGGGGKPGGDRFHGGGGKPGGDRDRFGGGGKPSGDRRDIRKPIDAHGGPNYNIKGQPPRPRR